MLPTRNHGHCVLTSLQWLDRSPQIAEGIWIHFWLSLATFSRVSEYRVLRHVVSLSSIKDKLLRRIKDWTVSWTGTFWAGGRWGSTLVCLLSCKNPIRPFRSHLVMVMLITCKKRWVDRSSECYPVRLRCNAVWTMRRFASRR
jgi:hypothetical protein